MSQGAGSSSQDNDAKLKEIVESMTERIKTQFGKTADEIAKFAPRILLVGPSGVGKSTLVNVVFGLSEEEQAAVRAGGRPCTAVFTEYGPFKRAPVIIIDSKGIEKEEAEAQRDEILKYVRTKNNDIDHCNHVHVAWYAPGERWEESDQVYVSMLSEIVKVVIVITKCDLKNDIDPTTGRTALENTRQAISESVGAIPIVECANPPRGSQHWVPRECPQGHSLKDFVISNRRGTWECEAEVRGDFCGERGKGQSGPYGYVELVHSTIESMPEFFRRSMAIAQVIDMEQKNAVAAAAIGSHTLMAMGVGAVSLPFSDLPLLVGLEATLSAVLFNIYDIDPSLITPEAWVKLNAVIVGVVGVLGSLAAKAMKMTVFLAPLGTAVDTVVAGLVVATLGCTIAAVCQSLPPRSDASNVDKKELAEKLCQTAQKVQLGGLDAIIKSAASAIGLGRKDGDGLVEKLASLISSVARQVQ